MTAGRETPLDLWSRRRARVRAEEEELKRARERSEAAKTRKTLEDKPDEVILRELGLPDPDDLREGDGISAFMRAAVPERLRRRALRALWRANPALANVDGLVDYGEDFANSQSVLETVRTAYTVGRGFLSAEEKAGPEAPAATETDDSTQLAAAARDLPDEEPDSVFAGAADALEPDMAQEAQEADAPPPPRRRMRFRFTADARTDSDQANQMERFE